MFLCGEGLEIFLELQISILQLNLKILHQSLLVLELGPDMGELIGHHLDLEIVLLGLAGQFLDLPLPIFLKLSLVLLQLFDRLLEVHGLELVALELLVNG